MSIFSDTFGSFGAPQFGVSDVKIAAYTSFLNYGTNVDVQSVQMYGVNIETVTADLEGDDIITAVHAKRIVAEVNMRFGAIRLSVFATLLGQAIDDYTTMARLDINQGNFPYIGVCGRLDAVEGSGDLQIFVPKAKVTSGLENIGGEYGSFTIPEVTLRAVADDQGVMAYLLMHSTLTAVVVPPDLTA